MDTLRTLEKKYFSEFQVIDGLNQHRDGLTFEVWLKRRPIKCPSCGLVCKEYPQYWSSKPDRNEIYWVENIYSCVSCQQEE